MSNRSTTTTRPAAAPEIGIGDGKAPYAGWPAALCAAPPPRPRRRPRLEAVDPVALSLTALLDLTAILLIFVLRSVASAPLALPPPGIDLPRSTAGQAATDATTIVVTADSVIVNDRPVLQLERGQVAARDKRGGGAGYLIEPLHAALVAAAAIERQVAQRNPERPFDGVALIVADRGVPFRLLSEVLYTAGQAEYGRFEFAAIASRGR